MSLSDSVAIACYEERPCILALHSSRLLRCGLPAIGIAPCNDIEDDTLKFLLQSLQKQLLLHCCK